MFEAKTYTTAYIEEENADLLVYKVKSNKGFGTELRTVNLKEGTCTCTQFIQESSPCVLQTFLNPENCEMCFLMYTKTIWKIEVMSISFSCLSCDWLRHDQTTS